MGFTWVNNSSNGADPAFAVDDIIVTGTPASSVSLTNATSSINSKCFGIAATGTVGVSVSGGTMNSGNVYTAYLSDANGSFASQTAIGTLASTATANVAINVSYPANIPIGTGYKVKVESSNLVAASPPSTASFVVHDMTGKLVQEGNSKIIDLRHLENGVYQVYLMDADGNSKIETLIKKN